MYPQCDYRESGCGRPSSAAKGAPIAIFFRDRQDAGRRLGERVAQEISGGGCIVLGLPRGGVPVAREVAVALNAPLDVLVIRKLGAPFNRELALGAIGPGGVVVYNDPILAQLGIVPEDIEHVRRAEQRELERRERVYRGAEAQPLDVAGRTVIVVDDGIATGSTMKAAVATLRALRPARIVVAVPTSARDIFRELGHLADKVIALSTPQPYIAVGAWYEDFGQISDEEVRRTLAGEAI